MKLLMVSMAAWAAMLLASIPDGAWAQSYYVNSQASEDGNGTSTSPWCSIEEVNTYRFSTGDDLFFKCGGEYKGRLNISWRGKQGDEAIIGSYGCDVGEKPTLVGYTNAGEVINVDNRKFISISNIEIDGAAGVRDGIHVQLDIDSDMDQISVTDVDLSNLKRYGLYFHGVDGGIVTDCTIIGSGDQGESPSAAIYFSQCSGLTFERNTIQDNPSHGISVALRSRTQGAGPNCIIRDNLFSQNGSGPGSSSHIKISNAHDLHIQSNRICCEAASKNRFGLNVIDPHGGSTENPIIIMGNMISDCRTGVTVGDTATQSYSIKVFNNTLKRCTKPVRLHGELSGSEIKNNIFYKYGDQSFEGMTTEGVAWDYNLWHPKAPPVESLVRGANDVIGDPGFNVSSTQDNCATEAFMLRYDSPARNKGSEPSIDNQPKAQYKQACLDAGFICEDWWIGADCCHTLPSPILWIETNY